MSSMISHCETIDRATCIVRGTHRHQGRSLSVEPGSSAVRHLHYGRIIYDAGDAPLEFDTGTRETGLIALNGGATIETGGQSFTMTRYDALYVPRDHRVRVIPGSAGCDLAEISAPVTGLYPLQFVAFDDVRRDPNLHFAAGGPSCE